MNSMNIPQSGFLPEEPKDSDYMMGLVTGIPSMTRLEDGNWMPYKPEFRPQFAFSFDTLSCTSFGALTTVEGQLNFLYDNNMLSPACKYFLESNKYVQDGKICLSRRYTAIRSGTTNRGNTFSNVWESIRKFNGVIPDVMFPFGGDTFEQYHNANLITAEMDMLGKQFLSYFEPKYDWIITNTDNGKVDTDFEKGVMSEALTQAPLEIAIPSPAFHATTLFNTKDIFDSYPPYIFTFSDEYPVQYILRGFIAERMPIIRYEFTKDLSLGSIGNDVLMLQKFLNTTDTPVGNMGKETTFFGEKTRNALIAFQKKWAIKPAVGYFGSITRKKVNEFCIIPKTTMLDLWALAIQRHEGFYPGSVSYRNNNPGNLRYVNQPNTTGADAKNFAIFKTYADGFQALKNMLVNAATGKSQIYTPNDTLYAFYAKYAPDSDGNNSKHYAETVAKALAVSPETKINALV